MDRTERFRKIEWAETPGSHPWLVVDLLKDEVVATSKEEKKADENLVYFRSLKPTSWISVNSLANEVHQLITLVKSMAATADELRYDSENDDADELLSLARDNLTCVFGDLEVVMRDVKKAAVHLGMPNDPKPAR